MPAAGKQHSKRVGAESKERLTFVQVQRQISSNCTEGRETERPTEPIELVEHLLFHFN